MCQTETVFFFLFISGHVTTASVCLQIWPCDALNAAGGTCDISQDEQISKAISKI